VRLCRSTIAFSIRTPVKTLQQRDFLSINVGGSSVLAITNTAPHSLQDSAGSKFGETVEDTKSGGGILDSFGGPPSGKSQEQKKDELVEEAKKPNPSQNFLGEIFKVRPCHAHRPSLRQHAVRGRSQPRQDTDLTPVGYVLAMPCWTHPWVCALGGGGVPSWS